MAPSSFLYYFLSWDELPPLLKMKPLTDLTQFPTVCSNAFLFLFPKKRFHHFLSFHTTSTLSPSYTFSYSLFSSLFQRNTPNFPVLVSLTLHPKGMELSGSASDLVSLSIGCFCKHRVSDLHTRMCLCGVLDDIDRLKGCQRVHPATNCPKDWRSYFAENNLQSWFSL